MTERRVPLWRPVLSWFFLILFCLAAPVDLVTGWARLTATDTESYTRTVSGLAADPRLQEAVAQVVTTRSQASLAGENPTASEAIIARQTSRVLGEATRQVVAGEAFQQIWEEANREAHRYLVGELAAGWGRPVTLDLSALQQPISQAVETLGVDVPADYTLDAEDLAVQVLDASTADQIRREVQQLTLVFWGSLAIAVIALALAVGLAPDRLVALARAGFGLAIAMIALIGLLLVAEAWVAGAAAASGGSMVVEAILETVTQGLRVMAVALAVAGLVVAGVFTGLAALRRSSSRRVVEV